LVALLTLVGCRSASSNESEASPAVESSPPSVSHRCAELRVGAEQHRGVCYAHNWQQNGSRGYGSESSDGQLTELSELGMDWISITPFGYQPSVASTEVRMIQWPAAENDERLRRTIEAAHARGLRVMLKPHIWISYSEWRGHIDPGSEAGWAAWFTSYERFILHYAELAQTLGADMFVVGVEFVSSTASHPGEWRRIIERVREVYSGPITYGANWDEAMHVPWWDAVDYIGVQMFAPLADDLTASYESIRVRAAGYVEQYRVLSERFGRPVILTEVGFKSIAGTAVSPYVWPEHLPPEGAMVDFDAQVDAYCAIVETFGQADFIAGMYWWKWFTDPETDEEGDDGFSPRGKPAIEVLRSALRRD